MVAVTSSLALAALALLLPFVAGQGRVRIEQGKEDGLALQMTFHRPAGSNNALTTGIDFHVKQGGSLKSWDKTFDAVVTINGEQKRPKVSPV
jgi:hypothetical protein